MKNLALLGTVLSCALVMISCGKEKKKGGGSPEPTPRNGTEQQLLGDEMVGIVEKYCVECHNPSSAAANLDLTQIDVILANAGRIVTSIQNGSMPSNGRTLTAEELSIVAAWAEAQYPAPTPGTTVTTDPEAGPDKDDGIVDDQNNDEDGPDKDNPTQNNDYKSDCDDKSGDNKDDDFVEDDRDGKGKGKGKGWWSWIKDRKKDRDHCREDHDKDDNGDDFYGR